MLPPLPEFPPADALPLIAANATSVPPLPPPPQAVSAIVIITVYNLFIAIVLCVCINYYTTFEPGCQAQSYLWAIGGLLN